MLYEGKIWLGTGEHPVCLLPQMANRHGLIAGATGTGKTVSLKVLAEGFSDMGVPVFLADIKGDLAGMVQPGTHSDNIANRLTQCGVPTFEYRTFPTVFWDVFGKEGHPVRTTVSEMGPTLLARLMNLNDTQAGVLSILFRVADDENMLLLDLKDLKAMLAYVGEHAKEYTLDYGNVSMASVGAIQRAVAMLEDEGGTYRVYGEDVLGGNVAMQAGADLAVGKHGDNGNIGAEDLIAVNPDAIFMVWYDGYTVGDVDYAGEQVTRLITENPAFASLDAVKNGRVYAINLSGIYCSGMRTLDGVLDFAQNLYPELYQ